MAGETVTQEKPKATLIAAPGQGPTADHTTGVGAPSDSLHLAVPSVPGLVDSTGHAAPTAADSLAALRAQLAAARAQLGERAASDSLATRQRDERHTKITDTFNEIVRDLVPGFLSAAQHLMAGFSAPRSPNDRLTRDQELLVQNWQRTLSECLPDSKGHVSPQTAERLAELLPEIATAVKLRHPVRINERSQGGLSQEDIKVRPYRAEDVDHDNLGVLKKGDEKKLAKAAMGLLDLLGDPDKLQLSYTERNRLDAARAGIQRFLDENKGDFWDHPVYREDQGYLRAGVHPPRQIESEASFLGNVAAVAGIALGQTAKR